MFNKKGQVALEFLTTYGWAFLVVLVMIGALSYFGVLNPENYISDSCNFGTVLSCSGGYGMSYDGADNVSMIEIDVTNIMSESFQLDTIQIKEKNEPDTAWVDVTSFTYTNVTGPVLANNTIINPQSTNKLTIKLDGTGASDEFYLEDNAGRKKVYMFKIEYYKAGSTIISSVDGTVTTKIREV